MIEIKLKEIAERLGKSISDIARETGLHRNTVNDLYHNKVDGLKFSTIDVLCDKYGITLQDLVSRKEFRIGTATTTRIVRDSRQTSPFFAWLFLNALHSPSPPYFDGGVGNIFAFFIRDEAEIYFDRREASICAQRIYERYGHDGLADVRAAFTRMRDLVQANVDGFSKQPLKQYIGADLIKAFQRLRDLTADMLAVSAWIDAFDFGTRDEIVGQVQNAQQFSQKEISLLLASGEVTSFVIRRIALLDIAKTGGRDVKRFVNEYPFVDIEEIEKSLEAYAAHPEILSEELETLHQLARRHAEAVRGVLRAHHMRVNPLLFFAELNGWREERDEMLLRVRFQFERLLQVMAERFHLSPRLSPFLLPEEIEHAQNGLVSERTLQYRVEQGLMMVFERDAYKISEGERAVSVWDDLISRYANQLSYDEIS